VEGSGDKPSRVKKASVTLGDILWRGWLGLKAAGRFLRRGDPRLRTYLGANSLVVGTGIGVLLAGRPGAEISIGASLVAAGTTGLIFLTHQSLLYDDEQRSKRLHEIGLEKIYLDRSGEVEEDFRSRLIGARHSIDILAFGLQHFREDFHDIRDWWSGRPNVRILLLDPEFPSSTSSFARQRDAEERTAAGKIAGDVGEFVRYMRRGLGAALHAENNAIRAQWNDTDRGTSVQLKLARCLPAITVFRIDDTIYWGPYLIEQASRHCPTMAVRGGRPMFDSIERHFNTIWTRWSADVPAEWLQQPPAGL